MKIDKKLRQGAVDYSMDTIRNICTNIPPRESGSDAERQAEELMAKDIKDNVWADEVCFQEFPVAPRAFMGFSKIIPILVLIGTIFFWFVSWTPILFNIVGLMILVLQFGMYKQFLDPFYKKKTSSNLIAIKKPNGETKKRIIFSGHADAAYEWTLFRKFGSLVHVGGQVLAVIFCFASIIISLVATISGQTFLWQKILLSVFLIGYIPLYLFSNYKVVVPGANDNLTGCLASVSILKYLKEAGIEYENTEVWCVIMGSEEAGLRGAKAFGNAYKEEFKDPKIQTVFIGLETFRDYEHMLIYERDLSGMIKYDPRAVKLLDKAAASFYEKPLKHASVYLGASDSAAITQAGIIAGSLAAMDPKPARYYHTINDNADNLDPRTFGAGLDIALSCVDIFDKEGI